MKINKKYLSISVLALFLAALLPLSKAALKAKASDLDIKYKNAYDATMKAVDGGKKHGVKPYFDEKNGGPTPTDNVLNGVKNGLQKDILSARKAIEELPQELLSHKQTLSSILDNYQHPIYERIVTVINATNKSPNQKDINVARRLIQDVPDYFKASYSSAIDNIQIGLFVKAQELTKKALASENPSDIALAQKAIDELKTNEFLDRNIQSFIDDLQSQLNKDFEVIDIQ